MGLFKTIVNIARKASMFRGRVHVAAAKSALSPGFNPALAATKGAAQARRHFRAGATGLALATKSDVATAATAAGVVGGAYVAKKLFW